MRKRKLMCALLTAILLCTSINMTVFATAITETVQTEETGTEESTEESSGTEESAVSTEEENSENETGETDAEEPGSEEEITGGMTSEESTDRKEATENGEEETMTETVTEVETVAVTEAPVAVDEGISIKANSGLAMLLMEDLQAAEAEANEEAEMDYCISDITVVDGTATVTLNAIAPCTAVVGIYVEETGKLLAYGTADISKDDRQVEVVISNGEIPQYYEVRGYLVNDSLRPLSKEYTSDMYTQAMQEFLSKRKEDFDENKVIELDENVETNFAVVSEENTLIVEETGINELTSYDEETNTYTFANANEQMTSLQTGDIFVYQYDETNIIAIEVADILVDDTTVTIAAETEELDAETVFDYIRIDEQVDTSSAEVTQEDCLNGVTYLGKVDEEGQPADVASAYAMRAVSGTTGSTLSWEIDLDDVEEDEVKEQGGYLSGDISGSATINFSLAFNIEYYFETKSIWHVDISIAPEASIEGSIEVEGAVKIPLIKTVELKSTLLTLEYAPKFVISGALNATIGTKVSGTIGIKFASDGITTYKNWTISAMEFSAEFKGYIGIDFNPRLCIADGAIAELEFETGVHLALTITKNGSSGNVSNDSEAITHSCQNCLDFSLDIEVPFDYKFKLLWHDGEKVKPDARYPEVGYAFNINLGKWYYSIDLGKGGQGNCPNVTRPVTITVLDAYGDPVKGADVYVSSTSATATTNSNGVATLKVSMEEWYYFASYTDEDGVTTVGSTTFVWWEKDAETLDAKVTIRLGVLEELGSDRYVKTGISNNSDYKSVCAIITADNALYMWGNNEQGQLGNRSTTSQSLPVKVDLNKQVKSVVLENTSNTYVVVGAITMYGELYVWGNNNYGQLGQGDSGLANSSVPLLVDLPDKVVSLVMSDGVTAAILENSDLYMWGYNGPYGLIADSTTTLYYEPQLVMQNVKEVAVSNGNTAVITNDGDLYVWGCGSNYLNGNGETTTIKGPSKVPVELEGKAEKISLSFSNIFVITEEKELYAWGNGSNGLVGNGSTGKQKTPCKVLENVKHILVCDGTSMGAITSNGELFTWGNNSKGQLGLGDTSNRTVPERVSGLKGITSLERLGWAYNSGSSYCTMICATKNGEAYWWGYYDNDLPVKLFDKDVSEIMYEDDYAVIVLMKDGSIWRVYNYYRDNKTTSILPIPQSEVSKSYDNTASTVSEETVERSASFDGLNPNEVYNFYAVKNDEKEEIFAEGNLLYMCQGTADADGKLTINYTMREAYEYADVFVVGETEKDISQAEVTIENPIHDGEEHFVNPKVVYNEIELVEGEDYLLAGDYSATEIGTYTVKIIGIGLYGGVKEVTYEVEPMRYTILFDSDGGSFVECQSVEEGKCIIKPEDPVRDGYSFVGWYYNDKAYDFTKIATDSITLKAIWREWDQAASPTADIESGSEVKVGTKVTLSCVAADAVIYYTTDGSEPTKQSKVYSKPIVISRDTEIRAFAAQEGMKDSEVVVFTYSVQGEAAADEYGEILPEDIPEDGIPDGLWIAGVQDTYEYTGTAIKPQVRVYDSERRLLEGRDYTITYKNNTKANDASIAKKAPTIVVKGKGNYSGTETKTFKITPVELTDERIKAEGIVSAYNKKVQKPVPVVTFNGKALKNKTDYTLSYTELEAGTPGANKEAGTYEVVITAKDGGNFTGSVAVSFEITNRIMLSKAKIAKIPNQSYSDWNGNTVEPELTVTMKGRPDLQKDVDYTVAFENNTGIGTATAVLTGIGEYAGTKKVTFKITGENIKGASVTGLPNVMYNGTEQKLSPVVTLKGRRLEEGTNYKVSYTDCTKAGKVTVTITGINDCTGTIKKTYAITPFDLEADMNKSAGERQISGLEGALSVKYVKGGSKPEIKLSYNGTELKAGSDYTISYKNNKKVADASEEKAPTILIKGKGNFQGTVSKPFTIEGKALDDTTSPVTISAPDVAYVNKAGKFMSKPILTDADGAVLKAGKDYSVAYYNSCGKELTKKDKVAAGSVITVKATGEGIYEDGVLSTTYKITQADFSKAKITIKPQVFTGDVICLDKEDIKEVKVNGTKITDQYGISYEIVEDSYKNNVKKGKATVTLKGKGNYGGNKTVTFRISAKNFVWFWKLFG